ncbi:nitroalkane oxidase [Sarocladium implicatum]|nr:nitroalkane oxidase [Sarocladium implicatum]
MADYSLSESQLKLRESAASFATAELSSAYEKYKDLPDQGARFRKTKPYYEAMVKQGWVKAVVPAPVGGTGGSFLDMSLIVEEFYAKDSSVNIPIIGTALGLMPLILGGKEGQQKEFLKPFVSGEGSPLASLAHSEPGGTANWLEKGGKGLGVTARKEGDFYIVNGEKMWTTNSGGWDGRGAELTCLCVRYSEDGGPEDPNADPRDNVMILLITRETVSQNQPGAYTILSEPGLMGHTAASGPHTRFTNFKVPANRLLCEKGNATVKVIETAFGITSALIGAMACGTMRTAFEQALKFAKNDSRGGSVPIIQRQSVADLLMNFKIKIDTSRMLVRNALDSLDKGRGTIASRLESCLQAKIFIGEAAVQGIWEAMQAVGMRSYLKDSDFPRLLNDAAVFSLFDGGNIGVRRRQLEKLMQAEDYSPWAASF